MRLKRQLVSVIVCSAATVVGCGSEAADSAAIVGGGDASVSGSVAPTASTVPATASQRLNSALTVTGDFNTLRADYVLAALSGAETRMGYQVSRDPEVLYMQADTSTGGFLGGGEILARGDEILLRYPALNEMAALDQSLITPETWLRPEGESRDLFGFVDEVQSNPRSLLLLYRDSFAEVVESGRERMGDGRPAIRYDTTIDFEKLMDELTQLYPETVRGATAGDLALLGFPSSIAYWVGEDGLVQRSVSTIDAGMQAGTLTTDYHSFDRPLDLPDIDTSAVQTLGSPSPHECDAPGSLRGVLLVQSDLDCDQATEVIDRFLVLEQKYGTVDDWKCGILGVANAEEHGYYLSCDRPDDEWIRMENP